MLRRSSLLYPMAVIKFLIFWCFASTALAQSVFTNVTNVATLPGYSGYISSQWKAIQISIPAPCIVSPIDNGVTFPATTINGSQYMQTVFSNNSAVLVSLPKNYYPLAYLSDGNILGVIIVDQGNSSTTTGLIMTPAGLKIAKFPLDPFDASVNCAASKRSGFLCYGVTKSSNSTGMPIWKYFDNLGRSSSSSEQSLQEFFTTQTNCCISKNANNTWISWYAVSTDIGSFLLAYSFFGERFHSVYAVLTKPNSASLAIQPTLLFETTSTSAFKLFIQSCGALQYGQGYFCIITSLLRYITFTSMGIIDVKQNVQLANGVTAIPLHYGGVYMADNHYRIYLADERMNILEMIQINFDMENTCISNNNKVFVSNETDASSWDYFSFDVKKLIPQDLGYDNLNIMHSTPAIDETVSLDASISLSIDFWPNVSQVRLNSGNIYIYQQNQPFPRQVISTSGFILSNKTSMRSQLPLLSSTLITPNATYYVEMDDGFAMTTELLPGVQGQHWVFQTGSRAFTYTGAIVVLLKFTNEGLKEYNRNWQFNDILLQELSEFIPISISCLEVISEHAYPNQSTNTQFGPGLYLNVRISSDTNNINSALAQSSLATLITNLAQTNLQYGNITKLLDPLVPAVVQEDIWDQFRIPIIAIGCLVVTLLIVYILARRRHKEGRNLAIFTIVLSLSDFVLDTLFVVFHNGDISILTIPILVFYIVPFTFNLLMAFKITLKEASKDEKFSKWFHENVQVAGIFTLLAITDVETLRVLDSHFAGLDIFNATFSSKAIRDMFIYSTLSFIIRDIPQLSIMILYKTTSVQNYSIIAFLTLISSAVICLVGILTRIYRATIFLRKKYIKGIATQDWAIADESGEAIVDENEEDTADENEEATADENEEAIADENEEATADENEDTADENDESTTSRQTNLLIAGGTSNEDENEEYATYIEADRLS